MSKMQLIRAAWERIQSRRIGQIVAYARYNGLATDIDRAAGIVAVEVPYRACGGRATMWHECHNVNEARELLRIAR